VELQFIQLTDIFRAFNKKHKPGRHSDEHIAVRPTPGPCAGRGLMIHRLLMSAMTAKVTHVFGGQTRWYMSSSCMPCAKCVYMHVSVYVCVCINVWSGQSLEGGTMAFLCSGLQVAVETQSQTKPRWHTECRERRVPRPPSGDTGQNRAIVRSNKCTTASIYDKHIHSQIPTHTNRVDIRDFHF